MNANTRVRESAGPSQTAEPERGASASGDPTGLVEPYLGRVLEIFDEEVRSELAFVRELVDRVRGYRGKLLRPRLVILSGMASGDLTDAHFVLAAVVEMVHMATLIHDDVLDEAEVRRRESTVNRVVGNEGAVMLGDYLISHAYHLCSSLGSVGYSRRIAEATNRVCEGELMQIASRGDWELSEARYLEIIRLKTAELTRACCEVGAIASGAREEVVGLMGWYGTELGMAFQIVDDLLDLGGEEWETGKSVGRDAAMGKMTLPLIRYRDSADAAGLTRLRSLIRGEEGHAEYGARELIVGSGAMGAAMDSARGFAGSAAGRLGGLPESAAREALRGAAEYVVGRRS